MNEEKGELVRLEESGYEVIPIDEAKQGLAKIRQFQNVVKELLVGGLDYGVIPGTNKPTLLKPGAEKLAKLSKLADTYEEQREIRTEVGVFPWIEYRITCTLTHIPSGKVISQGVGECNSYEGKYRYRWVEVEKGKPKQKVENEAIFDLVNTILKMAKKRALVDATLSACRLSAVFTQDIEDIGLAAEGEHKPPVAEKPKLTGKVTEPQIKLIHTLIGKKGISEADYKGVLEHEYSIKSSKDLTKAQASEIIERLGKQADVPKEPEPQGEEEVFEGGERQ